MVRKENAPASAAPETLEGLLAQKAIDAWVLCLSDAETSGQSFRNTPVFLRLDWRFRGALSRAHQAGALATESGEVSLLPCTRPVADQGPETFRILSVGVRDRKNITNAELTPLIRNIQGLGLRKIGISASDFGWTIAETKKHFSVMKGVETCVTE